MTIYILQYFLLLERFIKESKTFAAVLYSTLASAFTSV
jgi:hypothetical protein